MSDPTEYDPNSKDLTDDPNFPAPKCGVCGVPWADHMGIMGVCLWNKALKEDLVNLGKDNAQLYKDGFPYGLLDKAVQEIELLRKERDAALAVVDEFISDTAVNNETPIHECEFVTDPEKGKCDSCEAWGNYVGLFCSNEDEEETQ